MPIISSQIIEDSRPTGKRGHVTEEHTAGTGKVYRVSYLAEALTDIITVMHTRVPSMDQKLIDIEIVIYLNRIELGKNVIGLDYNETTQSYRAKQFLLWAKEMIQADTLEPLRYAWKVTEPYTIAQINSLLAGTQFEGKSDKIKIWEGKLKDMDLEMTAASEAAGEV